MPALYHHSGVEKFGDRQGHAGRVLLLIALVPAARLIELVESCHPGQVRYRLAIPSGFAEISPQARALQERLASAARSRGIRTLGPNVVGVMNAIAGINASMMPALPPGGRGLSCITQSGGFGMALSMYALDHDVKVAKFCDLGNMVDVQVHEILRYLAEDPDTEVVGLFLEAGGQRDAFRPAAEAVVARKPMIVTCLTPIGHRASFRHIGIADRVLEIEDTLPVGVVRGRHSARAAERFESAAVATASLGPPGHHSHGHRWHWGRACRPRCAAWFRRSGILGKFARASALASPVFRRRPQPGRLHSDLVGLPDRLSGCPT
jgi:Succinyl-CoA ligase like flavodoxin domain